MNPQPKKLQLIKETHLFYVEMDVNKQWYNMFMKVKETYKGKKFVLDGEEIMVWKGFMPKIMCNIYFDLPFLYLETFGNNLLGSQIKK